MNEQKNPEQQAKERELAAHGVPWPLIKAASGTSDCALGLRDGTVFGFTEASVHGQWVRLKGVRSHSVPALRRGAERSTAFCVFNRGVEVRLDDIVWVAEAPWGT